MSVRATDIESARPLLTLLACNKKPSFSFWNPLIKPKESMMATKMKK
jgi:hypothetical protein